MGKRKEARARRRRSERAKVAGDGDGDTEMDRVQPVTSDWVLELLERMLRERIFAMRDQGEKVHINLILTRVRRERWVRAYQNFWRSEGQGFFSVTTNLVTLLEARARIKSSLRERPRMPKLLH